MKHQAKGSTLTLNPRADVTRSKIQRYQMEPQKKTDVLQKMFLKKNRKIFMGT